MENGWIKLHRKLLSNPIMKRPSWAWLWVVLLLKANHNEKKMIWNDNIVIVKEGQFITGRKELSKETGIPETTIERILDFLETEHQIGQQKNNKFRLITIVNWKEYQTTRTSNRTTSGQPADTNKNDKKNKNNTSCNEQGSLLGDEFVEIKQENLIPEVIKAFEAVNPACSRMYGNKTQRKACQDLIDTYGFEQVQKVIAFLPQSNKMSFMPVITTPLQLWDKYQTLKDRIEQKRSEIKSKNNIR